MFRFLALIGATVALGLAAFVAPATAQDRPNIVVIWGDDVGFWNVGAYSRGMMGYQTPNIDRIAKEGALFTDVRPAIVHRRSCGLYSRAVSVPHWAIDHRRAGFAAGHHQGPADHCRIAEAARLHVGPVWQEPPR